jgi:transcriptional regulator with XRE-family HTH domain
MARLRVQELAEQRGLTISDLMHAANRMTPGARLTYQTVWSLWHNRTRRPDIETLAAVAKALGVRIGDLFANNEEEIDVPALALA